MTYYDVHNQLIIDNKRSRNENENQLTEIGSWVNWLEIINVREFGPYDFKPFHVVYNCRDTIQETNSIDLFMNYALFSIYKASFTQNRITKNIVIKHLSHLLRSRLDIEKNRICKRGINVKEWKDICQKVEEMFIVYYWLLLWLNLISVRHNFDVTLDYIWLK